MFAPRDPLNMSDFHKTPTQESDSDNMTLSKTSEEDEEGDTIQETFIDISNNQIREESKVTSDSMEFERSTVSKPPGLRKPPGLKSPKRLP